MNPRAAKGGDGDGEGAGEGSELAALVGDSLGWLKHCCALAAYNASAIPELRAEVTKQGLCEAVVNL